jgi:hypothetical protein
MIMANKLQNMAKNARTASTVVREAVEAAKVVVNGAGNVKDWLEDDSHVLVPNLLDKQFPMSRKTAQEIIENAGLLFVPEAVPLCNAKPKYRKCFDEQVVYSNPKSGSKILRGDQVRVIYVTSDVIRESQRLYDEAKQKSAEQREAVIDTGKIIAVGAKETATTIASGAKNTIEKIANRRGGERKKLKNSKWIKK